MKILLADAFDASLPDTLRKYGEVTADAAQLPEADIVLIRSKTKATKEYIDQAKKMKLIIRGGVGLDNVDVSVLQGEGHRRQEHTRSIECGRGRVGVCHDDRGTEPVDRSPQLDEGGEVA